MADVSSTFSSWSSTASNNTPSDATNIGAGLADNLQEIQAVIAGWRDSVKWGGMYVTSVAGTNTVTGNVTQGPTALAAGMRFVLIPANSNTGATTLEITAASSLGAKNVYLNGGALTGYELRKNRPVELTYDGTQFNLTGGAGGGDGTPVGAVLDHTGSSAPGGYVLPYGQAISRTTYADLYAVEGTTFGAGDGTTTFNVPDCRGRAVFGKDDMGGSAASRITAAVSIIAGDTLGGTGGEQVMHAHTHTLTDPGHTHTMGGSFQSYGTPAGSTVLVQIAGASTGSSTTGISIANSGSGSSQNMPPAIILNKILKT